MIPDYRYILVLETIQEVGVEVEDCFQFCICTTKYFSAGSWCEGECMMTPVLVVPGFNFGEEHTIPSEKFPKGEMKIHLRVCHVLSFAPSMDFFEEEEVEIGTLFHGFECFILFFFLYTNITILIYICK